MDSEQSWHSRAREGGRCLSCGGSNAGRSTKYCLKCTKKISAQNKVRRQELLTAGLCQEGCGRKHVTGRVRCDECLSKKRADGRREYNERVRRGQCVHCKLGAEVGIFCFSHWLKNVGVPHGLGNRKGIEILRTLWEKQGGRCALTGDALTPGFDASLDHIIPKSKGGTNAEENLQWVLLKVNRSKWDMSSEEFIDTCRKVVLAQGRREKAALSGPSLSERSN